MWNAKCHAAYFRHIHVCHSPENVHRWESVFFVIVGSCLSYPTGTAMHSRHRWNRVSRSQVTVAAILAGSGWVGSWASVSDPVLSFNMDVYRGTVSTEYHHLGRLISAKFHAVFSKKHGF